MSREETEQQREFEMDVLRADRAKNRLLFFDDLLDSKMQQFNPHCSEAVCVDLHLKLTQDLHLKLTHPGRQIMA